MSANCDEETKQEVTPTQRTSRSLYRSTITDHHTHTITFIRPPSVTFITTTILSSSYYLIIQLISPSPILLRTHLSRFTQTMVAGMDHFMGKPFNYVDLEAILEGHDSDKQAATAV